MVDVFIIGSKGIPAKYGGFETFVDQLTSQKKSKSISYHVFCMGDKNEEFFYKNTHCIKINPINIGSAKAILYDILSLKYSLRYISKHNLKKCIIYILACRIGPFLSYYKKKINNSDYVKLYVNPDGHEWKRSKWNKAIKRYWKYSERLTIKNADLVICDSMGIEKYIRYEYKKYSPKTIFIAYGSDVKRSILQENDIKFINWLNNNDIKVNNYYLIVGRFVPENNFEFIIKEFMKSNTKKDLVIISNISKNKFYNELIRTTHFNKDARIKFVGTVYDKELLKKVREEAFAYFHGHEVGGTNPSLLEALAATRINLLLDVVFNREVAEDGALYFSKQEGSIVKLISGIENLDRKRILLLTKRARDRISNNYLWDIIIDKYEKLFLRGE